MEAIVVDEMAEWTTQDMITGLARGDITFLEAAVGLREQNLEMSGLDPRTFALVKIAALMALDAPPASYVWQVSMALAAEVTPEELTGVLLAVAPQVGGPRVISAAAGMAFALDFAVEDESEPTEDDDESTGE